MASTVVIDMARDPKIIADEIAQMVGGRIDVYKTS